VSKSKITGLETLSWGRNLTSITLHKRLLVPMLGGTPSRASSRLSCSEVGDKSVGWPEGTLGPPTRTVSSFGRALLLHSRGDRIEACTAHETDWPA
jgi:hypothetical protein